MGRERESRFRNIDAECRTELDALAETYGHGLPPQIGDLGIVCLYPIRDAGFCTHGKGPPAA